MVDDGKRGLVDEVDEGWRKCEVIVEPQLPQELVWWLVGLVGTMQRRNVRPNELYGARLLTC